MNIPPFLAIAATVWISCLPFPLHAQPVGKQVPEVVEWISKSPANIPARFEEAAAKGPKAIEELVEHLRTKEVRDSDGRYTVPVFYHCFVDRKGMVGEEPRRGFQQRVLKEWLKEYPASPYAKLAEASFWASYAWDARGSKYANEVTDDQWQGFGERIKIAGLSLAACRELQETEPTWSSVALKVALGGGKTRAEFEEIATLAYKNFPECEHATEPGVYYLAPRWMGRRGEWEPWLRGKLKGLPDDVAARCYARTIVASMGYWHTSKTNRDEMYGPVKIDKELMRKGLDLLTAKYPESPWVAGGDAMASRFLLEDPRRVSTAFARAKGRVDTRPWSRKALYTETVEWLGQQKF